MSVPHGGGLFVKGYKELLRKSVAGHGHPDVADTYGSSQLLMLRSDVSFNRAFSRLKDAVAGDVSHVSAVRDRWRASKRAAREQLNTAISRTPLGTYLGRQPIENVNAMTVTTAPSSTSEAVPLPQRAEQAADSALQPILGQDGFFRRSIIYALASASRGFMQTLNTTNVEGGDIMERALQRPVGQALITVCNHVSALDDPLVMATIIPPAVFSQPQNMRWTLCAADRCFKYKSLSPFFTALKVLPIERGGGMQQAGMRAAEERLAAGDWVHVFPEGTRSTSGALGQVRKGIGRLVAACETPPLVVPFVHSGMEGIMPKGKVLPSLGKQVSVLVGEPISMDDILATAAAQRWSQDRLHIAIADRVGRRLHALKARLAGELEAHVDIGAELAADSSTVVSSLDLYDAADVSVAPASLWERLQFKSSHRYWSLQAFGMTASSQVEVGNSLPLASAAPAIANAVDSGSQIVCGSLAQAFSSVLAGHQHFSVLERSSLFGRQFVEYAQDRRNAVVNLLDSAAPSRQERIGLFWA